jgi:hypothetical protein
VFYQGELAARIMVTILSARSFERQQETTLSIHSNIQTAAAVVSLATASFLGGCERSPDNALRDMQSENKTTAAEVIKNAATYATNGTELVVSGTPRFYEEGTAVVRGCGIVGCTVHNEIIPQIWYTIPTGEQQQGILILSNTRFPETTTVVMGTLQRTTAGVPFLRATWATYTSDFGDGVVKVSQ